MNRTPNKSELLDVIVLMSPKDSQENKPETEEKIKVPRKPKYEGKTQDYWPKLVNDFKEEGKMFMYINLANTVAKEINDMTVAIEFDLWVYPVFKVERLDSYR